MKDHETLDSETLKIFSKNIQRKERRQERQEKVKALRDEWKDLTQHKVKLKRKREIHNSKLRSWPKRTSNSGAETTEKRDADGDADGDADDGEGSSVKGR